MGQHIYSMTHFFLGSPRGYTVVFDTTCSGLGAGSGWWMVSIDSGEMKTSMTEDMTANMYAPVYNTRSAVVEMVPCGVPFHLGDFDCSFSPGLVSLSPEQPEINLVTRLHPPLVGPLPVLDRTHSPAPGTPDLMAIPSDGEAEPAYCSSYVCHSGGQLDCRYRGESRPVASTRPREAPCGLLLFCIWSSLVCFNGLIQTYPSTWPPAHPDSGCPPDKVLVVFLEGGYQVLRLCLSCNKTINQHGLLPSASSGLFWVWPLSLS